jgi:hypothetical protein
MKTAIVALILFTASFCARAQRPAPRVVAPSLPGLSATDTREVVRRLLSLLRTTDPASSGGLYEAQQQGMALAFAAFAFGTAQEQDSILEAAVEQVESLPTASALLDARPVSRAITAVEQLSPIFTKARQRFGQLAFAVDRVEQGTGRW